MTGHFGVLSVGILGRADNNEDDGFWTKYHGACAIGFLFLLE